MKEYATLFAGGGCLGVFILDLMDNQQSLIYPLIWVNVFLYSGLAMMGIAKLLTVYEQR